MKELLSQLANYNVWATQLLLDASLQLPVEKQEQEVVSSFPSLKATFLHMWNAESIWWQRMRLNERITAPADEFQGTLEEAGKLLLQQSRQWQEWVNGAQEHMLLHEFIYQTTRREQFKQPVFQVVAHVVNHGTYHRGQVVNILRALGAAKIPQTDFIVFSRKK